MNHHHPELAQYITVVLGYTGVILACIAFFIYFLFQGLNTKDALVIDSKSITPSTSNEQHE